MGAPRRHAILTTSIAATTTTPPPPPHSHPRSRCSRRRPLLPLRPPPPPPPTPPPPPPRRHRSANAPLPPLRSATPRPLRDRCVCWELEASCGWVGRVGVGSLEADVVCGSRSVGGLGRMRVVGMAVGRWAVGSTHVRGGSGDVGRGMRGAAQGRGGRLWARVVGSCVVECLWGSSAALVGVRLRVR